MIRLWNVDLGVNDEIKCIREAIPFADKGKRRLSHLQLIVKDR